MTGTPRNQNDMPDVPDMDFVGALCEIWLGLNNAAYHLAYVRVYLQTAALQTDPNKLRKLEQDLRDKTQVDVVICRAHLAAFFWQLEHIFEALELAVKRGQKEHSASRYFWIFEKRLMEIEKIPIRQQINAYRNKGHEIPAIIGCAWGEGGEFRHHFLPTIVGHATTESIDLNNLLQDYFEFTATIWASFAPSDLKSKFPRNFKFPVTVPHSYLGELPAGLDNSPQLEVSIEAYDKQDEGTATRQDADSTEAR